MFTPRDRHGIDLGEVVADKTYQILMQNLLKASKDKGEEALGELVRYVKTIYRRSNKDKALLAKYSVLSILFFSQQRDKRASHNPALSIELLRYLVHHPIFPDSSAFDPIRQFFTVNSTDPDFQIQLFIDLQTFYILMKNKDIASARLAMMRIEPRLDKAHYSIVNIFNLIKANLLRDTHDHLDHFLLRLRIIREYLKTKRFDYVAYGMVEWINAMDWLRDSNLRKTLLLEVYNHLPKRNNLTTAYLLFQLVGLDDKALNPSDKMEYVKRIIQENIEFLDNQQLQFIYFFAGNYTAAQENFRESVLYFQYSSYFMYKSWEYLRSVSAYLRLYLRPNDFTKAVAFVEGRQREFSNLVSMQNTVYVETLQDNFNKIEELYKKVEELSLTDSLTKLHNRRYLENNLHQLVLLSFRHKAKISFVMMDLDYFKEVNDTYGHQAGDYALREISKVLKHHFRESDTLVRYGGEEFFAALFDMPLDRVFSNLERLRRSIQDHHFMYKNREMMLTISIGVTFRDYSVSTDTNLADIVAEADHALYLAKTSGRNQTRIYSTEMKNDLDNMQIDIFAPPE